MAARIAAMTGVLMAAFLVQTVVLGSVSILGWRPDVVALTVIAFALADGPDTGARYGFMAGLAADLLSASTGLVGVTALVLLVIGDAVGRLRVYVTGMGLIGESAITAAATATAALFVGVLSLLLNLEQFTVVLVLQGALAQTVWALLLAPAIIRPIAALSRRLPGPELLKSGGAASVA
jgi:rod shape-determining protein MreD